ncbi:MAG: hypothetical protein FJ134_07495 [Deltaproteobacteria bacterium]|nr:hypothetical protein [Deltaproteobacteria bacterium]
MRCPECGKLLDLERHGYLVFDGLVWCDGCRAYDRELLWPRDFQEIEAWGRLIAENLGFEPTPLIYLDDPEIYRLEHTVLTAEADHGRRQICLYPPGLRLATLCHELAHILTGQDHTPEWAVTFARLTAWVNEALAHNQGPQGFPKMFSLSSLAQWP